MVHEAVLRLPILWVWSSRTHFRTTDHGFGDAKYDGVGNLTSTTATGIAAGTTDYTYDSNDQLTNETTTRGGDFNHAFGYDDAGNPTTFEGATRTYNAANQRTGTGFAYDGNGNPTTYAGATCPYDVENHLTAYGNALTAGCRGDGKRAWKDNGTTQTYYVYDGDKLLAEYGSNGTITAALSWGPAGLFAYDGTQYQFDQQGNVVTRTEANGQVLSTHWFDAHGTEQTTASSEPFGYKVQFGYYTDRDMGLILCTPRYLDPESGRWLTRDPIGFSGGVNLYLYCANRSVSSADAPGLWFEPFVYHRVGTYRTQWYPEFWHERVRRQVVPYFDSTKVSHHYWQLGDGTELGYGLAGIISPGSNNVKAAPVTGNATSWHPYQKRREQARLRSTPANSRPSVGRLNSRPGGDHQRPQVYHGIR